MMSHTRGHARLNLLACCCWWGSLLLLLLVRPAAANVEKTIFLGPEPVNVPHRSPTFADLQLHVLSDRDGPSRSVRTRLQAEFPKEVEHEGSGASAARPAGRSTWFLLDDLTPGRRYEVRVCWPATEPTAFTLKAHEVPAVWETPELMSSLAEYASSRMEEAAAAAAEAVADENGVTTAATAGGASAHTHGRPQPRDRGRGEGEHQASMLLLQILAAADYFTDNETLMSSVSPVHVDVILDPFILNVLPLSLTSTICYILVVAAASWVCARRLAAWVQQLAAAQSEQRSLKKKQ